VLLREKDGLRRGVSPSLAFRNSALELEEDPELVVDTDLMVYSSLEIGNERFSASFRRLRLVTSIVTKFVIVSTVFILATSSMDKRALHRQ
jgi:hypothetical protein